MPLVRRRLDPVSGCESGRNKCVEGLDTVSQCGIALPVCVAFAEPAVDAIFCAAKVVGNSPLTGVRKDGCEQGTHFWAFIQATNDACGVAA